MQKTGKLIAAAVALATLVGTSAFADWRRQESRPSRPQPPSVPLGGNGDRAGRPRSTGGYSYWLPSSRLRGRDLRVGVSVRLGGVFRSGVVCVDDLGYPTDRYNNSSVRGVVERVDYRRGLLTLRDDYSGRLVTVDMVRADRRSRIGLDDLRRGDYVTLAGDWTRGGIFEAYRVDSVRSGRY